MSLTVDIVTPERSVYSGPATEVLVPGWDGQFDVLPEHTQYLSLLRGGVLDVAAPDGRKRFVIGRGFVEAGPERVTVLTDACTPVEAVDVEAARSELAELEAELGKANSFEAGFEGLEERLEIARAKVAR